MKNWKYFHLCGQGLIEMMVIVLFVAMGVIALVKFQNFLSYNSNTTQQQNDANILATNQLEILRDFLVLSTQSPYPAYSDIISGSRNSTVGNTSYTIAWTVTASSNPPYKTLDVTVSWTDRYNANKSVRLTTDVAGIDPSLSASIM